MVDLILIILSNYSNVVRSGATPLSGLGGETGRQSGDNTTLRPGHPS